MPRPSAKLLIERAALESFAAHGFDATTTRAIAEGAGVSEGAIYRHFRSKDEIAAKLFLAVHSRLTGLIEDAASIGVTIEDKVEAIVAAYCETADADWRLFSFHLLWLHRFLHLWQDDGRDPVTAIEIIVASAIDRGDIPPGDPRLLGAMALGCVTQAAQNKAYGRLPGPLSVHKRAFVTAILAVLKAR